jgi:hypothetical protein
MGLSMSDPTRRGELKPSLRAAQLAVDAALTVAVGVPVITVSTAVPLGTGGDGLAGQGLGPRPRKAPSRRRDRRALLALCKVVVGSEGGLRSREARSSTA